MKKTNPSSTMTNPKIIHRLQAGVEPLLAWYAQVGRELPWRVGKDPYRIWVSEIMLQQTRIETVKPYFARFLAALPDVQALSNASEDELLKLWQGLGYYSRVANMQKAAQIVCRQYGGQLPADYAALRALPGIGDYTAGAIASIAFGIPAPAVDGNVLRVFARLDNSSADITKPAAKREFTARVLEEMPKERPGPYNEALMELGALVCLPNGAPKCEVCPLAAQCKGRAAGRAEQLPVKTAKPEKTLVPVTAALITGPQGMLLQRRPSKGLLAGLWQPLAFESTAMTQPELDAALRAIGLCVQWQAPLQSTRHVFTHRIWQISGFCGTAAGPAPEGCVWASRAELNGEYAVPSAFAGIMRQWQPE